MASERFAARGREKLAAFRAARQANAHAAARDTQSIHVSDDVARVEAAVERGNGVHGVIVCDIVCVCARARWNLCVWL